ncbi:MAG TPA: sigma-70 family RNA polymerase sigma factor [Candidatus Binataceae bacterium]|nr:sigma-70 family RNA polymerase sigma factor [Candidatus Binataceae bacterium]
MDALATFRAAHREIIARLYERSAARRWAIAQANFAEVLYRALERRFGADLADLNPTEIECFLESLHVEDLALAIGCRAGKADAWREFDEQFSGGIGSCVRAVVRDRERARELAGSIYGDLFDSARTGDSRRSPLDHYHGRSAMAAWLRVVVVRRAADWLRERYHTDAAIAAAADPAADGNRNHAAPADPDRALLVPILAAALDGALAELDARDRLRLSYYYVQGLTLAETGVLLGEHESSVSRNLARVRLAIRQEVARVLKQEHHLSDDQITRCFEFGTDDWPFDLGRSLSQAK